MCFQIQVAKKCKAVVINYTGPDSTQKEGTILQETVSLNHSRCFSHQKCCSQYRGEIILNLANEQCFKFNS